MPWQDSYQTEPKISDGLPLKSASQAMEPVAVAIALAELGLLGLLAALVARQEPLESGEI